MKKPLLVTLLCVVTPIASLLRAAASPIVPDWALPGSATHQQVPPPKDFHRATKTDPKAIGIFAGQSDVGGSLVPGSATFEPKGGTYTINSAGYNIWYTRDEFRYLWQKMSGDVSLAANITFPKPEGYDDRKVVLIIRESLEDDAQEVMTALHGAGLIHLAQRPEKNTDIAETCRIKAEPVAPGSGKPIRLGLEKRGDTYTLYVSLKGEPMHPVGTPAKLHLNEPFYVGIGFTSHLPVTSDTAVVSNVVLENAAGKVK